MAELRATDFVRLDTAVCRLQRNPQHRYRFVANPTHERL